MVYDLEEIKKDLRKILSPSRYQHSLAVMERAEELAVLYHADVNISKVIGLTHDIAREFSEKEVFQYVFEHNIEMDEIEQNIPILLHGKIGADICKKRYHFTLEMQNALISHTTGEENMSLLSKILFVADKTERTRKFKDLDLIIDISNRDLDAAVLYILNFGITRFIQKNDIIPPKTVFARNYFLSLK